MRRLQFIMLCDALPIMLKHPNDCSGFHTIWELNVYAQRSTSSPKNITDS